MSASFAFYPWHSGLIRMKPHLERHAMRRWIRRLSIGIWIAAWMATGALAQKTLTWDEAKRELEAANPTLARGQIGIQESRADEITAFLRPNPDLTVSVDQFSPFTGESLSAVYRHSAACLRQLLD